MNARGLSRRHLIAACEASLARLKSDWIDLYQLHHCSTEIPIDETLRALDDLITAGNVRYVGCSMLPSWRMVVLFLFFAAPRWWPGHEDVPVVAVAHRFASVDSSGRAITAEPSPCSLETPRA